MHHTQDAFEECSVLLVVQLQITERHFRDIPVRDVPVLFFYFVSRGASLQPLEDDWLERALCPIGKRWPQLRRTFSNQRRVQT